MTRITVSVFAEAMEDQLRANDHKTGWGDMRVMTLFGLLKDEIVELEDRLNAEWWWGDDEYLTSIQKECADIGNFAMMIFDRLDDMKEG
jgi:hypothetical protein